MRSYRVRDDQVPLLTNVKIHPAPNSKEEDKDTKTNIVNADHPSGSFDVLRLLLVYDILMFLWPRAFATTSKQYVHRAHLKTIKYKSTIIQDIDMCCCFLSLVSLAAAVTASWNTWPFCRESTCARASPLDYFVPLHDDNNIFVQRDWSPHDNVNNLSAVPEKSWIETSSRNLSNAIQQFESGVQQFCNHSTHIKISKLHREWDNISYSGVHIQQPAASYFADFRISSWMPSGYYPWLVLMYIFTTSFGFQFYRYTQNNVYGDNTVTPIGFPTILLKYLFFQGTVCDYDVRYNQYKPDFWRWVEYTLTSPFQILLIANSVMITDRGKLLALMSAQAALVMLGSINEHVIDKIFKKMVKSWEDAAQNKTYDWPRRAGNNFLKIRILLIVSWFTFVAIWWGVLSAFERQERNTYTCNYPQRMPAAIWFIVGTQFGFFALFGCVQTVQYFQLLYLDVDMYRYEQGLDSNVKRLRQAESEEVPQNRLQKLFMDETKNEIITESEKEMQVEEEYRKKLKTAYRDKIDAIPRDKVTSSLINYYTRRREQSWQNTALAYSLLSVIAKTTLEFGFIWLVYFGSFADVPVR